jgi:mitochondrial inner membrane protease subunit 2
MLTVPDRSPNNPERLAIKRVIALEGDIVYTRAPCPLPTVQVPVNHVWVEGDNRNKSLDSNNYGPLPISLIQGKLTHVLWPWKSSGPIHWRQFRGKTRVVRGS